MGRETAPLLFAGQYEDNETRLVYNRYRYYNPHTVTYTAQDPLGVGPNPATAQGYVTTPLTWTDKLGLQAHKKPDIPDTVQKVNGQNPINAKYAGKEYPLPDNLKQLYPDGVRFNKEGFPEFEPYIYQVTVIENGETVTKAADVRIDAPGKNREADYALAEEKLGITRAYRKEHGLTWHHQDTNRMMLIPTDLHSKVSHTGGFKIWGAGKA